jgi:hypothetical protein
VILSYPLEWDADALIELALMMLNSRINDLRKRERGLTVRTTSTYLAALFTSVVHIRDLRLLYGSVNNEIRTRTLATKS